MISTKRIGACLTSSFFKRLLISSISRVYRMSSEKHVIFGPLVLKWPKLEGQSTNFGLKFISLSLLKVYFFLFIYCIALKELNLMHNFCWLHVFFIFINLLNVWDFLLFIFLIFFHFHFDNLLRLIIDLLKVIRLLGVHINSIFWC